MTILIIIAVVLVIVFWGIGIQRNLVSADEKCSNSMSQIGVQQNSRWDAITSLVDLTKSYNEHEYKTLSDVVAQRREITSVSSSEDAQKQEDLIGKAISSIKLVAEQYPTLKANENYAKTMDSVNQWEEKVRMSRMVYNDSVTKFNRMVRQFPDSVVAGLLRFNVRAYLESPDDKSQMPKINI